jgi:hypothetical protein
MTEAHEQRQGPRARVRSLFSHGRRTQLKSPEPSTRLC